MGQRQGTWYWHVRRKGKFGHRRDKGYPKGREVEVEEEAEERNLNLDENMSVLLLKWRVSTQEKAINPWMCPYLRGFNLLLPLKYRTGKVMCIKCHLLYIFFERQ